jgi:hypothetical protein
VASSPEVFAVFQQAEAGGWFKIIRDNGIKAD